MSREQLIAQLNRTVDFAAQQVRNVVERYPGYYPMYTVGGKWNQEGELWTHWCDGFLPGMMWLLHERTGDAWWRQKAEEYSKPLEPRKMDRDVHDLGFIFISTYYRWYQLTQDPALKEVLIQAGQTMGLRFNENGRFLRSFVAADSLFIDIMMNVGIIFYAAEQTNDAALRRIATEHCLTTRRTIIRGDGSTSHEGIFDLETGEFLRQTTHQGYRGDSCWSRGLTWSLYGFGTAYGFTRDPRFLEAAELCADCYIASTPEQGVPPWDYDAPAASRRQYDSSAAAIAASGLWNLASIASSRARGRHYRDTALRILATLTTDEFLGTGQPGWEGLLRHGVYHINKGLGVDESVMWGEHFFLEAVVKALKGLESGEA